MTDPASPAPTAEPSPRAGVRTAAVLVVDDERGMLNFLGKALSRECALVEVADRLEAAEALRRRFSFDVIVLDIRLPDGSGLDWLRELRERDPRTDVIVMTAYADVDAAVGALRAGAADFLLKPFRLEQLLAAVRRCLDRRSVERENFLLRRERGGAGRPRGIIGESARVREVIDLVRRVAPSASTVLIEGETGTGKELVARAIHELSGRAGPFVPVNCGSIAPDLLESELFGHVRGAFTGAHATREGLFSFAHAGTLLLDEIGEMPLPMQAKLLRALESKTIRPVGADRETPVDVRVLAATNRPLASAVGEGRFREDLFYRLNVVAVAVPPLRERPEDIALLAEHFAAELSRELGLPAVPFSGEDLARLRAYPWPGNVRELRNVVERATLLGRLPVQCCAPEAAAPAPAPAPAAAPVERTLAEVEREHITRVLQACGGNKSRAARVLGVSRKTLERKAKAWAAEAAARPSGAGARE